MNVADADRRNNSHFDIPNRIYLLNDVLQQTQIIPYYGCRYGLKFDLEYNLSSSANNSEDIFQWDWCALYLSWYRLSGGCCSRELSLVCKLKEVK